LREKKLLIICDSHGTKWGATGYAWQLKEKMGSKNVDIIEFGGISIQKIPTLLKERIDTTHYTYILIGLGNVDVHPRMPLYVMKFCRKIKFSFIREGLFNVPPTINLSYIVRLPFFLLKLIIIRFIKQTYSSNKKIKIAFTIIYNFLNKKSKHIILLPLFEVNEKIYTQHQNIKVIGINNWLKSEYTSAFLEDEILKKSFYKNYYNYDFFHFKTIYHSMLADLLFSKISN